MRTAVAGIVVVLGLAATAAAPASPPVPAGALGPGGTFFDDDGNIHEGAIEAIHAAGITRGCGADDLYCPASAVTRGQMAAFLRRALDLPTAGGDPFDDDDGTLFETDIAAVAAAGITRGCGPARFCPDRPVTRGEMAAFLTRALDLPAATSRFVDDDGSIFEADVAALAEAGITKGCNPPANDFYCPDAPVLRDQMASFLTRALGLQVLVPLPRPFITLAFTGDVLIHRPVWERAAANGSPFDFRPMLAPVSPIIESAGLAICHLEVPLSADNSGLSGYPNFNAPRQVADGLAAAGYEGCSTASNHSFDQGVAGVESTLEVLATAGLRQAGMALGADGLQATMYQVGDHLVAHLASTYWLNGYRLPDDKPWLVQLIDVPALLEQAAAARQAGADVVVVSTHCCTEYQSAPTSYQRDVARSLIASPDVDLVVGHHAHVVQPIEKVDEEYILYGLGNFLSAQRSRPATQDGVIAAVEFAPRAGGWSARGVTAHPTWVEGGTYRVLPAADFNPTSWGRTASVLRSEGAQGVIVVDG